jgi:hypothetical protein
MLSQPAPVPPFLHVHTFLQGDSLGYFILYNFHQAACW